MARASLACLAVLAAVACERSERQPLIGRTPAGPHPATPPPSVVWRNREIAITGLPAVADDGSSVVIAHRDSDGGRGNPNLTLIEKDRSDRVVHELAVITATEVDQLDPAEIARRFDAAARWLDERHAAVHLVAMIALEAHRPTDEAPASATGGGATVRWTPSKLVIELAAPERSGSSASTPGTQASAEAAQVVRTTPSTWLVADRPLCATCTEVCHNEAYLGGGYLDRARRLAVVVISFLGSDTCAEPGPQAHVVAW